MINFINQNLVFIIINTEQLTFKAFHVGIHKHVITKQCRVDKTNLEVLTLSLFSCRNIKYVESASKIFKRIYKWSYMYTYMLYDV